MTQAHENNDESGLPFRLFSLEFLIVFLAILVTTGAINGLFSGATYDMDSTIGSMMTAARGQTDEYSTLRAGLLFPMYAYSIIYLVMRWRATLFVAERIFPLIVLTFLAVLSSFWSLDPDVTLRRSLNVLGGTSVGLYLILRLTPAQFCRLLGISFVFISLLTLFAVVFVPSLGIHHDQHFPAWRGFFSHKNAMGSTMVVGYGLALLMIMTDRMHRLGWSLLLLAGTFAIASLSRTAWVNMFVITAAFALVGAIRSLKGAGAFLSISLFLFMGIFIGMTSLSGVMGSVASSLGRTSDLTGRTEIWSTLLNVMTNGPLWFGYGYESFWTSYQGALSLDWGMSGFVPFHAHNGWLQMMTHLGLVGTGLITYAVVTSLYRSYRTASQSQTLLPSFAFLYLVYYTFTNMSEARFMSRDQFFWIVFLYCATDPTWRQYIPLLSKKKGVEPSTLHV